MFYILGITNERVGLEGRPYQDNATNNRGQDKITSEESLVINTIIL